MNSISAYTQSGTTEGKFVAVASGDLTGKEGYFVKPTNSMVGKYMEVIISSATTDTPVYLLNAGATTGKPVELLPLNPNSSMRAVLTGSVTTGSVLTLAADGTVKTYASASDTVIGTAEENGVAGQYVKFRPAKPGATTAAVALTNGTKASAGSSQTDAAALTAVVTYVTGADGVKGVKLPSASAGAQYVIFNQDKDPLLLYPNTSDAINNGSVNAAVSVPGWSVAICYAVDATYWATVIGSEYRASYNNIVAVTAAGTGQGDGLIDAPSGATINATGGDGTKVVTLPTLGAKTGFWVEIFNNSASNLPVFPPTSGTINGGSANASVTIATKTLAKFTCIDGTDWAAAEPAKA